MDRRIKNAAAVLGGLGAGAAIMYLLDPERGSRRRSLIRDKAVGTKNDVKRAVVRQSKHLRNRAQGLWHEAGSLVPLGNGSDKTAAAPIGDANEAPAKQF